MQIKESIVMALNSLRGNKLRSILTLVGIGIGLFSIIIVMTAIGAIQQSVEEAFSSIGTKNFIIQKYPAVSLGPRDWRKYRNRKDLSIKHGEKLKDVTILPKAIGISMNTSGKTVKYKNNSTNPDVSVVGVNVDEITVNDYEIAKGRGFTKQDIDYVRNEVVIGHDVANLLFPSEEPVGKEVHIENKSLKIIGVYKKVGSVLGQGQDNFITIPLDLFKRMYGDDRSATYTIMAPSAELLDRTMDEVIGALRVMRKVPLAQDNDFEIVTNDQLMQEFNDLTAYFRMGALVVAFIALLAAGVGIMNIMLVSVTERTREIGIRKAIGARKAMIRSQFVVEAVVLSQIGGIIGIILGVLGGNIVAVMLGVSGILPVEWIVIGLAVTTMVGVVFGVYPAIKASNLDPIEALRFE